MPVGDNITDHCGRAILKLYLYSGVRFSTGCRLKVSDSHQDSEEATTRLHEKGDKRRTIGLHYAAAQAIVEYIEHAGLTSGPLFRPRLNPDRRSWPIVTGSGHGVSHRLIESYLEKVPGALKESGTSRRINKKRMCIYSALITCNHRYFTPGRLNALTDSEIEAVAESSSAHNTLSQLPGRHRNL